MHNLIILVGRSCSGKTYIVKELQGKYGIHRAITFTTRAKRSNEIDGVDYKFITLDQLYELQRNNQLVEYIKYLGNYYGLSKDSFDYKQDNVVIVEPNGARQIKASLKHRFNVIMVKIDAPDEVILERFKKRGDSIEEIRRRFESDKELFGSFEADKYIMYPETFNYEAIIKEFTPNIKRK